MNAILDETLLTLNKSLKTASLRQNVINNNIANINTPGYKRSFVNFEYELQRAIGKEENLPMLANESGHMRMKKNISKINPNVEIDNSTSLREDGNNVDINTEMVQTAMNVINYNLSVNRTNGKLASLRYVINDGRR